MSAEIIKRIEELASQIVLKLELGIQVGESGNRWVELEVAYQRIADNSAFDEYEHCFKSSAQRGVRKSTSGGAATFPAGPWGSPASLAQLLSVLSVIHRALVSGSSLTKRDLYYADPALFGSQSVSDGWLAVVQSLFNVPRWRLGVYAAMRGLVVGDLDITISKPVAYGPPPPPPPSFTAQATTRISVAVMAQSTATPSGDLLRRQLALRTGPDVVASRLSATVLAPQRQAPISRTNLSFALGREIPIGVTPRGVRAPKRMVGVPPPTEAPGCASTNEPITYVRTRADFLLLVEKETIFHKLMSLPSRAEHGLGTDTQRQSFAERYNCIVMTGRGYPGVATRNMAAAVLSANPGMPAYVLVDADPHGIEIYAKYAFGSAPQALDCPFGIKDLIYLGLRLTDIDEVIPALVVKGTAKDLTDTPQLVPTAPSQATVQATASLLLSLAATPPRPPGHTPQREAAVLSAPRRFSHAQPPMSSLQVLVPAQTENDHITPMTDLSESEQAEDSHGGGHGGAPGWAGPGAGGGWSQRGLMNANLVQPSQVTALSQPSQDSVPSTPGISHNDAFAAWEPQPLWTDPAGPAKSIQRFPALMRPAPVSLQQNHPSSRVQQQLTGQQQARQRQASLAKVAAQRVADRVLQRLTERDHAKIDSLMRAPYFSEAVRAQRADAREAYRELLEMRACGEKAELDALAIDDERLLERYIVDSIQATLLPPPPTNEKKRAAEHHMVIAAMSFATVDARE